MEEEHKDRFILKAPYKPTGDQPEAIAQLTDGLLKGDKCQTLLGVTGSGKNVYDGKRHCEPQPPHAGAGAQTKRVAAQLCTEFKEFFPDNAVEYFVSYYDYYQPEAYIPSTDTYIEKDSAINEEIDRLRHSADSRRCRNGATLSSWPACRVFTLWATPLITAAWSSACGRACT